MQKAGVAELGAEKRYDQGVYKQEGSAEEEGEGVAPDSPVAEQFKTSKSHFTKQGVHF